MNATEIPMQCHQPSSAEAVHQRHALLLLAATAWTAIPCRATGQTTNSTVAVTASASGDSIVTRCLQTGGCVVLLRHAATEPGVGDPPDFSLDDCRTQRNLSAAGQHDARRIGIWFASRKLTPRAVLFSAWCRCKDTADLAFGKHAVWAALNSTLNSTFGDRVQQPDQTPLLRQAMARIPARQFEVWVTHQVNISALTGQGRAMGEAFILDRSGRLLARSTFA